MQKILKCARIIFLQILYTLSLSIDIEVYLNKYDNIDSMNIQVNKKDDIYNQQIQINNTLISSQNYDTLNIESNITTDISIYDYKEFNDWDNQQAYIVQQDLDNNTLKYQAKQITTVFYDNTTENIFNFELQGKRLLMNFNNESNIITIQYKQFEFVIDETDQLYGNINQFSSYINTSLGKLNSIYTTLEAQVTTNKLTIVQFIPTEWLNLNISIQFQNSTIKDIKLIDKEIENIKYHINSIKINCNSYYSLDHIYVKYQLQNSDELTYYLSPCNQYLIYMAEYDEQGKYNQVDYDKQAIVYDSKYLVELFNTSALQDEEQILQDYLLILPGIQNSNLTARLILTDIYLQQKRIQNVYFNDTNQQTAILFTQQNMKLQNLSAQLLVYNQLSLIYKANITIDQPHYQIQIDNYNSEVQITKFRIVDTNQQPLQEVEVILQFMIGSYSQTLSEKTDKDGIGTFECSVTEQSCQLQGTIQLQVKSGKHVLKDTIVQVVPQDQYQTVIVQVQNQNKKGIIIAVSVSVVVVVIILIVSIVLICHYKNKSKNNQQTVNISLQDFNEQLKYVNSRSVKFNDSNLSLSII